MLPDAGTALSTTTIACGVGILIGLVGIILPVLPGTLLILASVLAWALVAQDPIGWIVLAAAVAIAGTGWTLQYLIPGRRMRDAGVPKSTLLAGAVLGVVGFFVIPVLGLVLGFVGGVLLAEFIRSRDMAVAWPSTVHALKAAALSYGIEFTAGLVIAVSWVIGAWRLLA